MPYKDSYTDDDLDDPDIDLEGLIRQEYTSYRLNTFWISAVRVGILLAVYFPLRIHLDAPMLRLTDRAFWLVILLQLTWLWGGIAVFVLQGIVRFVARLGRFGRRIEYWWWRIRNQRRR